MASQGILDIRAVGGAALHRAVMDIVPGLFNRMFSFSGLESGHLADFQSLSVIDQFIQPAQER